MTAAIKMTEDMLQVYSADVFRAFKLPGVIAYHVPNGGHRHIAVAIQLKKFGTLPGVPDWNCVRTDGRIAYLELKDATGKQSEDQKEFQRACIAIGVPYEIARTPEQVDAFFIKFNIINKPSVTQPVERQAASCRGEAVAVSRRRLSPLSSSPESGVSRQQPQG